MGEKGALVTLAIGAEYIDYWNRFCRDNWSLYAQRHGLDVLVITAPLDSSARANSRSPAWQKCLILGQDFAQHYGRLVWVDSDIVINPQAPCILDGIPEDKIGGVISGSHILRAVRPTPPCVTAWPLIGIAA